MKKRHNAGAGSGTNSIMPVILLTKWVKAVTKHKIQSERTHDNVRNVFMHPEASPYQHLGRSNTVRTSANEILDQL